MPFSVKDVPDGGLCGRCSMGHVTRRGSDVRVYCQSTETPIDRAIDTCSTFQHKGSKSRWQFEEIAWVLEVTRGKVIGFRPPKDD